MSHHAKCFDTATQRALPIWRQSSQVLVSPRRVLSKRARTKSPPQHHHTMQPDWQQKGQNWASLSTGCLSGGRRREKRFRDRSVCWLLREKNRQRMGSQKSHIQTGGDTEHLHSSSLESPGWSNSTRHLLLPFTQIYWQFSSSGMVYNKTTQHADTTVVHKLTLNHLLGWNSLFRPRKMLKMGRICL